VRCRQRRSDHVVQQLGAQLDDERVSLAGEPSRAQEAEVYQPILLCTASTASGSGRGFEPGVLFLGHTSIAVSCSSAFPSSIRMARP
jgi:hypothetical protein